MYSNLSIIINALHLAVFASIILIGYICFIDYCAIELRHHMLRVFLLTAYMTAYCTLASAANPLANATATDTTLSNHTSSTEQSDVETSPTLLSFDQMLTMLDESLETTIKLDNKGVVLTQDSEQWDCIHQKTSGLTWEVKKLSGLRDKSNTYTWVENTPDDTPISSWFENDQGKCTGEARCDTSSYVTILNQQKLCNFADWRLPTKSELESLIQIENARLDAKIDSRYFPNTLASWYWTADENEKQPEYAWYVLFRKGVTLSDKKHNPKHLRLVRGTMQ